MEFQEIISKCGAWVLMPKSKKKSNSKNGKPKDPKTVTAEDIIAGVVEQLKPQMDEQLKEIKGDLQKDINEKSSSPNGPQVGPNPQNIEYLKGILGQFGVKPEEMKDLDKIASKVGGSNMNLGGMVNNPMAQMFGGKIPDLNKLTEGQLKYMQMVQGQQMLPMLIPLFSQSAQQNPMMAEMMQRTFMEKLTMSTWMERMYMGNMAKMMNRPDMYEKYMQSSEKYMDPIVDPMKYTPQGQMAGSPPPQSSIGQPMTAPPQVVREPKEIKALQERIEKLEDQNVKRSKKGS